MGPTFDPSKNSANLRKHGVPLSDGDGVLNDPLALTVEDDSIDAEQRFVTVGLNSFGVLMVVVFTNRDDHERLISVRRATPKGAESMKKEYDFSKAKRGAVVSTKGKTRITIFLDDAVVARFKEISERSGTGYQTLINDALNAHLGLKDGPITRELVRKIVREELTSQS